MSTLGPVSGGQTPSVAGSHEASTEPASWAPGPGERRWAGKEARAAANMVTSVPEVTGRSTGSQSPSSPAASEKLMRHVYLVLSVRRVQAAGWCLRAQKMGTCPSGALQGHCPRFSPSSLGFHRSLRRRWRAEGLEGAEGAPAYTSLAPRAPNEELVRPWCPRYKVADGSALKRGFLLP